MNIHCGMYTPGLARRRMAERNVPSSRSRASCYDLGPDLHRDDEFTCRQLVTFCLARDPRGREPDGSLEARSAGTRTCPAALAARDEQKPRFLIGAATLVAGSPMGRFKCVLGATASSGLCSAPASLPRYSPDGAPLRVSFNLDDADLQHFAAVVQQTHAMARRRSAQDIIAAARKVLEDSEQAQLADFLVQRQQRLRSMLEMACDADWRVAPEDSQRLLNALACFGTPAPQGAALNFLDHAIMIELVGRDLTHDLDAYRDFCKARTGLTSGRRAVAASNTSRPQWLEQRCVALQARMHQRRQRDRQRAASPMRRWFSLLGL